MCGRYASSRSPEDLIEEFDVVDPRIGDPLAASYNVAPTDRVYAVLERASRTDDGERGDPVRQLRELRWGLVPSWAKDAGIGSRMINARLETAAEKPAFRKAWASRRCLVPADGYFEWYTTDILKAGKPMLELQTRIELTANQAAFRKLGFHETARTAHAGYDRPTSVTMRKVLS